MKGLLLSAPMVRAFREGRKTCTRRLIPAKLLQYAEFDGKDWWYEDHNGDHHPLTDYCRYRPGETVFIHARFMPERFARDHAVITDVRAERLQEITEAEAVAEGLISTAILTPEGDDYTGLYASDQFPALWESIHGPGSWDANPWVWVLTLADVPATGTE